MVIHDQVCKKNSMSVAYTMSDQLHPVLSTITSTVDQQD